MRRGKNRTGWLAAALAVALTGIAPASIWRGPQQKHAPPPKQQSGRPAQRPQQPRGHGGDWLRRYKDVPPSEQERELRNDPQFQRLSPEKQEQLRQRLQRFSNLPPQQQLRMLNRQETWEHLTPEQQEQVRRIEQLPPDRRRMVRSAARDLSAMPEEQREQVINSERFKKTFSDQEREMLRSASRLPFAPAEGGEAGPPE